VCRAHVNRVARPLYQGLTAMHPMDVRVPVRSVE
jgi:hypothetical protein